MSKTPLTIQVEPEAALAYEAAPPEAREAFDRIMSLQLLLYASRPNPSRNDDPERPRGDETGDDSAPTSIEGPQLDRAERLRRLRAVCGIWEDRTDLPTRDELRKDWENRLQRLGLGD